MGCQPGAVGAAVGPGYHGIMATAPRPGTLVVIALAITAGAASAEPEGVWDAHGRGYVPVPGLEAAAAPPSRVLFLNDCKPNGCDIIPGNFRLADDSRQNVSSIVRPVSTSDPYAPRRLSPYAGSAAAWQATVDCVRAAYAPFDVTIVTVEPPATTSYYEVMAAGLPADVGFPSNVVGVASFACGVIPNAISFGFLNRNPGNVLDACWTVAQQSGHSFGLAHEVLAGDLMSTALNPPDKTFRNQTACIGADACCSPSQECGCGATTQNSFATLLSIFGPAGLTPPEVIVRRPAAHATVAPGFPVEATISDINGVDQAELFIDGALVQTLRGGSGTWTFQAPADIAVGPHELVVRARDALGAEATLTVPVTVAAACAGPAMCADDQLCVDGRCVAGPGVPGGIGAPCADDDACLVGTCATVDGARLCAEACGPSGPACGPDFACTPTDDGGAACWPTETAGCGCTTGGRAPVLPIAAGALVAALLGRRRGRR